MKKDMNNTNYKWCDLKKKKLWISTHQASKSLDPIMVIINLSYYHSIIISFFSNRIEYDH